MTWAKVSIVHPNKTDHSTPPLQSVCDLDTQISSARVARVIKRRRLQPPPRLSSSCPTDSPITLATYRSRSAAAPPHGPTFTPDAKQPPSVPIDTLQHPPLQSEVPVRRMHANYSGALI
jgi:hypothetical protein